MSLSGSEALLRWCQNMAGGYPGITVINNFKAPFRDGLIFCAILCSYDKTCIDYSKLSTDSEASMIKNHALAFKVAEERFGIEPLLDADDMLFGPAPDARSVMTYVSQMYKYLKPMTPDGNPHYRAYERMVSFFFSASSCY
jgi:spectrin beta